MLITNVIHFRLVHVYSVFCYHAHAFDSFLLLPLDLPFGFPLWFGFFLF